MIRKAKTGIFVLISIAVFAFEIYTLVPDNITVLEGKEYQLPKIISGLDSYTDTRLTFFGVVPYKNVQVNVVPDISVIPVGKTVGVTIDIEGVMVLGFSDVRNGEGKKVCPAKDAGLRSGDIITALNGNRVDTIDKLTEITETAEQSLKVEYSRDGAAHKTEITPVLSTEDQERKLGVWVRDKTTGIGTLTYVVPETGRFGALGHPITDSDTDQVVQVGSGRIQQSEIVGITKGVKGRPGELKGVITSGEDLGTVTQNNSFGIFGVTEKKDYDMRPVPIAMRGDITEGAATIVAGIDGEQAREYSAEIIKIFRNSYDNKSMIIKITDWRLIEKTGGIIQGMSGCPILQRGKIVGAVTHVLVNEPTKGYGIFIELMLAKSTN